MQHPPSSRHGNDDFNCVIKSLRRELHMLYWQERLLLNNFGDNHAVVV